MTLREVEELFDFILYLPMILTVITVFTVWMIPLVYAIDGNFWPLVIFIVWFFGGMLRFKYSDV